MITVSATFTVKTSIQLLRAGQAFPMDLNAPATVLIELFFDCVIQLSFAYKRYFLLRIVLRHYHNILNLVTLILNFYMLT